jgi:hypothetical protein
VIMNNSQTDSKNKTHTNRIRQADIRQLLFHVNSAFHTRVNLLLVAESIFFAAIASLWGEGSMAIKLIVCGLGVTMTMVLWFANATLKVRTDHLTKELMKVDGVYLEYMEALEKKLEKENFPVKRLPTVTGLLTHFLPLVMLVAWVLVIYELVSFQ